MGQWLSEDPIGLKAGDSNVRRYVRNRITSHIDSTGLDDDAAQRQQRYTIDQAQYESMTKALAGVRANQEDLRVLAALLQAGRLGLAYARCGYTFADYDRVETSGRHPATSLLGGDDTKLFHNSDSEKASQAAMNYKAQQLAARPGEYTILRFQMPTMIINNNDIAAANSMIAYNQLTFDRAKIVEGQFNVATYIPSTDQWEWINHGFRIKQENEIRLLQIDMDETNNLHGSDSEYVVAPNLPSAYDPRVYLVNYRPNALPDPIAPLSPPRNPANPLAPPNP